MRTRVLSTFVLSFVFLISSAALVAAQSSSDEDQLHHQAAATTGAAPEPDPQPQRDMQHMDMQHMNMSHGAGMFMPPAREGSGTSWLPDETPMYAVHRQAGDWTLMAHWNAFVQYLHDSGDRGAGQAGSINWFMGMADRTAGGGHLGFRAMLSLEPWTIAGCGYPDLLSSGEVCNGESIHDRQHPHDLFMELAATYDHPLAGDVRWQVYGGPSGEPALGPTAFPHRLSAIPNPLAPITHHWFDATHITYGVITGGVYGKKWKAEASLFNGREPDENRVTMDFGALDSYSGRVWFLPTPRWALQVSAGHLTEAEAGLNGEPRTDVDRVTATATYHRIVRPGTIWASTFGWGRNSEPGQAGTNALLAESSLTLDDRDTWFGRFELSAKSGHDLDLPTEDIFTVAKIAAGYTRYLDAWHGMKPGIGGAISTSIVPSTLSSSYGSRANFGVALFVTLRPSDTGSR